MTTKIRFFCKAHQKALINVGSGRVFSPTYTLVEECQPGADGMELRKDHNGWLHLDMSELSCPHRVALIEQFPEDEGLWGESCCESWEIQTS